LHGVPLAAKFMRPFAMRDTTTMVSGRRNSNTQTGTPAAATGSARANSGLSGQHKLAQALQDNATLSHLLQRVQQSSARLQDISHLLTPGLQCAVQAGPLDDEIWTLTVANASAAAKLRQMLPQLQEALQQKGWPALQIKLRVMRRN